MTLEFPGNYSTDVRPPRKPDGRKAWAKDPTSAESSDGTRLDATFVNDLVGLLRGLLTAYGVEVNPGDDSALAQAVQAAIDGHNHDSRYYTETEVDAALGSMAPLASPTLTGTPAAPTATPGTNTTQIATTAFVAAAVAALLNSAPGALDTLDELAAALGDDANFATTVTNALALKAPLASPALSGTPTAPTAAPGTNTTQIATTAFVAAIAALLAPLASPALTGVPTAPTAAGGTNTTQIATTAFVVAAIAAISSGVVSFNTRTGAVTLTSGDVTGALTYTPVRKSGDTMTGGLTITNGAGLIISKPDATTGYSSIQGEVAGSPRWLLSLGTPDPEGGGNNGSEFKLYRYSDAGAILGTAITVNRSNGVANLEAWPTVAGASMVKTVNGSGPDGSGNVAVSSGATLIASGSFPVATVFDITGIPQTYRELLLVITDISHNLSTRQFVVKASKDNGSTFPTTIYTTAGITGISDLVDIRLTIDGYAQSGGPLLIQGADNSSGGNWAIGTIAGDLGAINALRVALSSTGSIDAGTYALYGVK